MPSSRCRRAWLLALLSWVCLIWGHSLLSGDVSGQESGFFVGLVRPLFGMAGVTDEDLMSFVVRKAAHFSEYLVLGTIVVGNVRHCPADARLEIVGFLLASVAVPFVDESIQLLVPGRAGMLRDVLIDLAGLATGLALTWAAARDRRSSELP